MTDLLALLLRPELPNVQKELPTAEYRVKRLSEALGTDVVFKLRALPYGKVKSIRDSVAGDPGLDILLAGCVEPDLKAKELKEKYGGATPAETVKAMLLPGEIEDLSRAVERLCGFRRITSDEVKNAGRRAATQSWSWRTTCSTSITGHRRCTTAWAREAGT